MPDVTTTEFVVTGYVNERFEGVGSSTSVYAGVSYTTFDTAPYERWVDTDNDGWFDYGTRDEGYGHWSRFDGFVWRDTSGRVIDEAPDENRSSQGTVFLLDQPQDIAADTSVNDWFF